MPMSIVPSIHHRLDIDEKTTTNEKKTRCTKQMKTIACSFDIGTYRRDPMMTLEDVWLLSFSVAFDDLSALEVLLCLYAVCARLTCHHRKEMIAAVAPFLFFFFFFVDVVVVVVVCLQVDVG
jgi:hypothetical protein